MLYDYQHFSSTHMAFSVVLNFCSARRLSSALQVRTEHIRPAQEEPSRARLQSVITARSFFFLSKWHVICRGKTTWDIWMDIWINTCFKSGIGSSFSSFDSSSHNNTCRAASYCAPYSTGNTSCKRSLHLFNYLFQFIIRTYSQAKKWINKICLTWKKYALSTGSFSRLWTSAMNVDSVVFTSASLNCNRQASCHLKGLYVTVRKCLLTMTPAVSILLLVLAPASAKTVTWHTQDWTWLTGIMLIACLSNFHREAQQCRQSYIIWMETLTVSGPGGNIVNKMCCLCRVVSLCCGVCLVDSYTAAWSQNKQIFLWFNCNKWIKRMPKLLHHDADL